MLKGLFKLSWIETKIFLREPLGVLSTLFMPVVFFLIMARFLRGLPRPTASLPPRPTACTSSIFQPAVFQVRRSKRAATVLATDESTDDPSQCSTLEQTTAGRMPA